MAHAVAPQDRGLWNLPSLDNLSAYARAVNAAPMLSPERERWLAERLAREGALEAASELVWTHLRLVVKIAREHAGYGLPQADLIQEGNVGLMMAVKKFDASLGARLAAYAAVWIRAEIQEYILGNWRMVKIGAAKGLRKLFFNLRRLQEKLRGESPLDRREEIAKLLGVQEREVETAAAWFAGGDAPLLEEAEALALPAPSSWQPERAFEASWRERELPARVREALSGLSDREREVVEARFLDPQAPATLAQIGERLSVSVERARQIEAAALRKLRQSAPELRDLL